MYQTSFLILYDLEILFCLRMLETLYVRTLLTSSVLTSTTYLSCRADLHSTHHRKMILWFLSHLSPSEHICSLLVISPSSTLRTYPGVLGFGLH